MGLFSTTEWGVVLEERFRYDRDLPAMACKEREYNRPKDVEAAAAAVADRAATMKRSTMPSATTEDVILRPPSHLGRDPAGDGGRTHQNAMEVGGTPPSASSSTTLMGQET